MSTSIHRGKDGTTIILILLLQYKYNYNSILRSSMIPVVILLSRERLLPFRATQ